MTWFAQSANQTESAKAHVQFFVAVDFDFPSGHARIWSGPGDIVLNGNTYLGFGALGTISQTSENDKLVSEKKTYQLSGVDPALVAEADIEGCFGRSVTEYFGFINTDTKVLVTTPEIFWQGTMGGVSRRDGPSPIIEVSAVSKLAMLDRSSGLLWTTPHQSLYFPGDTGFDQVPSLATKTVVWGGQRVYALPTYDPSAWNGY